MVIRAVYKVFLGDPTGQPALSNTQLMQKEIAGLNKLYPDFESDHLKKTVSAFSHLETARSIGNPREILEQKYRGPGAGPAQDL
jgi:hypothetical protein